MAKLNVGLFLVGMAIAGVGVASASTNPDEAAYHNYATTRLTSHLKTNVCPQAPNLFGNDLEEECMEFLNNNQSQLKQLIASETTRENYLFLSIYSTRLSAEGLLPAPISQLLPSYQFQTVGVFQQFFTIKAERQ